MLIHPIRERLYRFPGSRLLLEPVDANPEFIFPMEKQTLGGNKFTWEYWRRQGFGVIGKNIRQGERLWTILGFYSPISKQGIGVGIRAMLRDQNGFTTFLNQRDLEVLLQHHKPGDWCEWLSSRYPNPGTDPYIGFCMDIFDSEDDLQDREWEVRKTLSAQYQGDPGMFMSQKLPNGLSIDRCLHLNDEHDVVQTDILLTDTSPTGMSPDISIDTIGRRWTKVQAERVRC